MKLKYLGSIIILFMTFTTMSLVAQEEVIPVETAEMYTRVAFLNSNDVLDMMPDRVKATETLEGLNQKYKDELQVMQNDYSKKYSDYISYQSSMADNIRLRRMQELYELERHINEFMQIAQKDVEQKEKELMNPIRRRLKNAINEVGTENNFICIYDLANPTIVFVTPNGVNITELVKNKLEIK